MNTDQPIYEPVPLTQLWIGVAAGPVIWAVHLVVVYAIQSVSCHRGFLQTSILGISALSIVLLVLTVLAAAGILAAGLAAYRNYRSLVEMKEDGSRREERSEFMSLSGALLSGLFLLSLVLTILPIVLLRPCSLFWW